MRLSVAVETEVFERNSNCLPLKVMRCIVRAEENKKTSVSELKRVRIMLR